MVTSRQTRPANAVLSPVLVTNVKHTPTAIPARVDIRLPPADVLMVTPRQTRPANAVQSPAPVISARAVLMLLNVRALVS